VIKGRNKCKENPTYDYEENPTYDYEENPTKGSRK
jgi:hypothetical protein